MSKGPATPALPSEILTKFNPSEQSHQKEVDYPVGTNVKSTGRSTEVNFDTRSSTKNAIQSSRKERKNV